MPDIHASTDYLRFNQNKFFYQINYDSNQKRLSLDQIHIRIGDKFQAELPDFISNKLRKLEVNKETLLWNPKMCQLNNPKLKNYLNKIVEKKLSTNINQIDTLSSRDNIIVSFNKIFIYDKYY